MLGQVVLVRREVAQRIGPRQHAVESVVGGLCGSRHSTDGLAAADLAAQAVIAEGDDVPVAIGAARYPPERVVGGRYAASHLGTDSVRLADLLAACVVGEGAKSAVGGAQRAARCTQLLLHLHAIAEGIVDVGCLVTRAIRHAGHLTIQGVVVGGQGVGIIRHHRQRRDRRRDLRQCRRRRVERGAAAASAGEREDGGIRACAGHLPEGVVGERRDVAQRIARAARGLSLHRVGDPALGVVPGPDRVA